MTMHTRTPYQPTSIPTPRSLQEDRDSCSDSAIVRGSPSRQTIFSGVIDQVFCLAFRFAGVAIYGTTAKVRVEIRVSVGLGMLSSDRIDRKVDKRRRLTGISVVCRDDMG